MVESTTGRSLVTRGMHPSQHRTNLKQRTHINRSTKSQPVTVSGISDQHFNLSQSRHAISVTRKDTSPEIASSDHTHPMRVTSLLGILPLYPSFIMTSCTLSVYLWKPLETIIFPTILTMLLVHVRTCNRVEDKTDSRCVVLHFDRSSKTDMSTPHVCMLSLVSTRFLR